jgi:DNA-binding transcriptional ArsR family regulator
MNKTKVIEKTLACIDSDFIKALAEPARIEILKFLILSESSDVKTLAEKLPQDRSVISRHLAMMEKAGLLKVKREGRHVIYSVDGDSTLQKSEQLVTALRQCVEIGCC